MDVNNGQQRCSKHPYGSEYKTVLQDGNIKFVKYRLADNAKAPLETQTKKRIYVTVNSRNVIKFISFYDKENKRIKRLILMVSRIILMGRKRKSIHTSVISMMNRAQRV